ncbi:uncharacterized protein LOC141592247 [Silene latifolia]|uniref:uncharacterized protein LOC141592247 n=1 Tax=Silene latifolia TaxID=37657 RepID=UPI003D76FA98
MGRKAKASKSQIMKEPLVPKSPVEGATNDSHGNLDNVEHGASVSGTSPPGKTKSKTTSKVFTRRSQRVQPNSVNQVSGPVVHEIISETENSKEVPEKDKEDETRVIEDEPSKSLEKTSHITIKSCRRNLKVNMQEPAVNQVLESVDEIISETENNEEECEKDKEDDETRVIELNKSLEKISNETDQNTEEEILGGTDMKYKAMYINSQRKIESLMEENRELTKLLEHAVGKIDVFEKQSSIFSEVMNVFASLSKVNENLSRQVKRGGSYDQNDDGIRASKKNKVGFEA